MACGQGADHAGQWTAAADGHPYCGRSMCAVRPAHSSRGVGGERDSAIAIIAKLAAQHGLLAQDYLEALDLDL